MNDSAPHLKPGRRAGQRGRSRALGPEQVAWAQAAKARGVSDVEVGRHFGCTARTVVRSLARAAKAGQPLTAQASSRSAESAATSDVAPPGSDPGDVEAMTRDEQRRHWSRVMREAIATAEGLRAVSELEPAARWLRIASQAGATLAKLSPSEEPPDPNQLPDMVAAADRGRAKLWDYLERLRAGT